VGFKNYIFIALLTLTSLGKSPDRAAVYDAPNNELVRLKPSISKAVYNDMSVYDKN